MFVVSVFSVSHITTDKAEWKEVVRLVLALIVYSIPRISYTRMSSLLDQFFEELYMNQTNYPKFILYFIFLSCR